MKVILALIIYLILSLSAFSNTITEKRNFVIEAKLSFLPKIPIMDIATILSITDNKYVYEFSIRTNNIVEFINNVNGDGRITGTLANEYYKPLHYKYKYKRKEKEKLVEIKYKDSEIIELNLMPMPDKTKLTKINDDMLINTIDPSTFFLNILSYKNINNCNATFKIFDGKRRYNVEFNKKNKVIKNDLIYCEAKQTKLGGYKIDDNDDVFASSDYIKVIYKNNENYEFHGYEAINGSVSVFINEIK